MTLFGLDLNAGRARAVAGPAGDYATPLPLQPPRAELPLAVSLEGERLEVGAVGLRLCRRAPHLARTGFLLAAPSLSAGRLNSDTALSLIVRQLARACLPCDGGVIALPAYLDGAPLQRVLDLADQEGLGLTGGLASPLALALAAHAESPWDGPALVVEADEHALTFSAVVSAGGEAHLRRTLSLPRLGLSAWRERLLNAIADRCILQSRRDPRDCPHAEQALFDRLDDLLDGCREGRAVNLPLQVGSWFQNVVLQPADVSAACAGLTRLLAEQADDFLAAAGEEGAPVAVLVCADAARLPGLMAALEERFGLQGSAAGGRATRLDLTRCADFGEGLLEDDEPPGPARLTVLGPNAVARAAHGLAAHFARGDLLRGYLHAAAPLPLPQPAEAGPARLQYQGEEFLLDRDPFALGRQPSCDLVFDGAAYPTVAPRHCEIVHGDAGCLLWDRSRGSTFVNERPVSRSTALQPGDTIRLGPDGPVLRFLGQTAARPALVGSPP